jgi:hypothetical protein
MSAPSARRANATHTLNISGPLGIALAAVAVIAIALFAIIMGSPPGGATLTYLRIVLEHALPSINIGLYSVSLVLLAMGLAVDAFVTFAPVAAYVAVGIWQETRANATLAAGRSHRRWAGVDRCGAHRGRGADTGGAAGSRTTPRRIGGSPAELDTS